MTRQKKLKKKLRSGRNNINALPKQRPVTPPHTALPAACRTGCGLSTLTVEFNPIHHELTVGFRQCYICFIVLVLVVSQLAVQLASSLHKSTTLQFYSLILVKVAIWGSKFEIKLLFIRTQMTQELGWTPSESWASLIHLRNNFIHRFW